MKLAAGPGHVALGERPVPVPGPAEALVRVRVAGLCHTDVAMANHDGAARSSYRPRFPLIMGHELTGTVEELGPEAEGPEPGTPVVSSAHLTCGRCRPCRSGRTMLCTELRVLGLDVDGAFTSHVAVPSRNLFSLCEGTPWEAAAVAEPFAVASHAVRAGEPQPGERVAIVGPGAVGLCALVAALEHVDEVAVFGLPADARQLRVAESIGAATAGEVPSDGDGSFELVIETAGHPEAVRSAIRLCRPGGRVVCVGLPPEPVAIDTAALAREEKRIVGVRAYELREWETLPGRLLAAAPRLRSLVTHVLGLGEFERALSLVQSREAIKVLLDPAR